MNVINLIVTGAKAVKAFTTANAPALLTIGAVVGVGVSTLCTVKATKKVTKELHSAKAKAAVKGEEVTKKETAKIIAKRAWPAAVAIILTCAAILGANHVSSKRIKALAAAYSGAVVALNDYQNKAIEEVGPETAAKIKKKVDERRKTKSEDDDNVKANDVPVIQGNGDFLVYLPWDGTTLYTTSVDAVTAAIQSTKLDYAQHGETEVQDFYYELGATSVSDSVKCSRWTAREMYNDELCIITDTRMHPTLKVPCLWVIITPDIVEPE